MKMTGAMMSSRQYLKHLLGRLKPGMDAVNNKKLGRRLGSLFSKGMAYGIGAGVLWIFSISPLPELINLHIYDFVLSTEGMRPGESVKKTKPLVIGISEQDIAQYGWPINDSLLCDAIEMMAKNGVSAIGLDLYRERGVPDGNECLKNQIKRIDKLVSIRNMAEDIPAIEGTKSGQQAFNDLVVDADRVVRRDLVHVAEQEEAVRSLPLRLLEIARNDRFIDRKVENLPKETWLSDNSGGYTDLSADGYQTMLPFLERDKPDVISLADILQRRIEPQRISGRIALIGATAESTKDLFEVPHSRFSKGHKFLHISGVEIHALRVSNLSRLLTEKKAHIQAVEAKTKMLISLFLFVAALAFSERPKRLWLAIAAVAGLSATTALVLITAQMSLKTWVGVGIPVAAVICGGTSGIMRRGIISQKHHREIQRLLGQTTSTAVAEQLWERRDELMEDGKFKGQEQDATILFSDTCNFTTISEGLSPSDLVIWLNRGVSIAVDAITENGGMINKFTGDGMLAVFGVPISAGAEADAQAAVFAAARIQSELKTLNEQLRTEKRPEMRMRIGLHSGRVLTGSVGNTNRLEYAVMGDAVNCASRLESHDKSRQDNEVRVLVSQKTRELVDGSSAGWRWKEWGEAPLKGRNEPLLISELVDR